MAKHGYGTTFTWNSQTVGELTGITPPRITSDSADVSTHQSTSAYKEYVQGMLDAGEVSLTGFFKYNDANGQIAMLTDMNARTTRECVITLPDSIATFTFNAFLTAWELGEANKDGAIPFNATLRVTGKPTLATTAVVGMSACGFSNDVLMMPSFAIGTYEYVVTITNGQTSTVITPVDATSGEVITITANGVSQTVTTGEASSAIAVAADDITDIVITISKAACVSKVYTFHCAVLAA
jgi:hypothetical protein